MTVEHYIAFIGAGQQLSDKLKATLTRSVSNCWVVAPAMRRGYLGNTEPAVLLTAQQLHRRLASDRFPSPTARLYLFLYEPTETHQLDLIWNTFGHASWIEQIPLSFKDKITPTVSHIEQQIGRIQSLLHKISEATCSQRKSCPLALPLRNFGSRITNRLKTHWYNGLDEDQLTDVIRSLKAQYNQVRVRDKGGFKDNKNLVFKPANDNECHGIPHPLGNTHKAFLCGRFRFGVSLYPGFHFDVSSEKTETIQCNLVTEIGCVRMVGSEHRRYINIFPNDYLLPAK